MARGAANQLACSYFPSSISLVSSISRFVPRASGSPSLSPPARHVSSVSPTSLKPASISLSLVLRSHSTSRVTAAASGRDAVKLRLGSARLLTVLYADILIANPLILP